MTKWAAPLAFQRVEPYAFQQSRDLDRRPSLKTLDVQFLGLVFGSPHQDNRAS